MKRPTAVQLAVVAFLFPALVASAAPRQQNQRELVPPPVDPRAMILAAPLGGGRTESAVTAARLAAARRSAAAKEAALEKTRPHLTGRWVLVAPVGAPSNVARSLTVRRTGGKLPRTFTVERHFDKTVVSQSYVEGIGAGFVGGIEDPYSSGTDEAGWTANQFRIVTERCSGPTRQSSSCAGHVEVWSLDRTGRLRIQRTERATGTESTTISLVYRRPAASAVR